MQNRYPAIEKLCKRLGIMKDDAEWAGLIAVAVAALHAASKPNSDAIKSIATDKDDAIGGEASIESI